MINQPTIPKESTALVLNDMINGNLRRKNDAHHNHLIESSGIIKNSARLIEALHGLRVPVIWIRVERRADYADAILPLTDTFLAGGRKRPPAIVKGSYEAENVAELPVQPDDHVVTKPRLNPFIGTDLDLQLRARKITTLLVGGYSTNMGVESGVRTARDLGYNVVVVSDCCYNVQKELHEWALTHIMPSFSRVLTSNRVLELLT